MEGGEPVSAPDGDCPAFGAPPMTRRTARLVHLIALALGVGLLAALVVRLDLAAVRARLVQAGWYFPLAFACYAASNVVTTLAWREMIDPRRSRARFRHLLAAFWAGHALNAATPGASAGEVLKGTLLREHVESAELVASLVTLNFFGVAVVQAFVLLAPLVCLAFPQLPPRLALGLLGAALAFAVPVVAGWILLRLGMAERLVRLVTRLPLVRPREPERWVERARTVDARIRAFTHERPAACARAVAYLALVRVLQVAEVYVLLIPLLPGRGAGERVLVALATQTMSQLLAWAASFVPGQVGVAEGGSAMLFRLLGHEPVVGLSLELLRRLRKLLGIGVGLVIGLGLRASRRSRPAPLPAVEPAATPPGPSAPPR